MTLSERPIGYLDLLRGNTSFRRLWIGNVVSLFGDWFNTIALYSLILGLTGSEFALGAVFITKMLPAAFASPLAGMLVDRFNRRKVLIATDLIRAVVVLGLLVVDEPGEVFVVYVITTIQTMMSAVFRPAQNASLPNMVRPENLITANTLMSSTWSLLLTVGAAFGGLAVEAFGIRTVFVMDSVTYLVSAFFIYRAVIPQKTDPGLPKTGVRTALREVVSGWNHIRARPRIGRMALAKAAWSLGGGGMVYTLTLVGQQISPERQALAIGLLFAARGFGTGIGPIASRAWFKDERTWPAVMGACILVSGLGYILVGSMSWTFLVTLPIIVSHAMSGANWVLSSVELQKRTEDRFRGRVFASEWIMVMLADTISILTASLILESGLLSLSQVIIGFAISQVIIGLLWLYWLVPAENRSLA